MSFTFEGLTETLVQERSGSGVSSWTNLPSGPWLEASGGGKQTAIRDLHGDVIALSSPDGSSVEGAFWYSPFGERAEIEPATPSLGYQGQMTDPFTGLVDMTTRQYLPSLGRFTTPDVLFGEVSSPMSLNQYGYALANPVTFTDPSGMCVLDETTGECYQPPTDNGGKDAHAEGSPRGAWTYAIYAGREDYVTNGPITWHVRSAGMTITDLDPFGWYVTFRMSGEVSTISSGTDAYPEYSYQADLDVATVEGVVVSSVLFEQRCEDVCVRPIYGAEQWQFGDPSQDDFFWEGATYIPRSAGLPTRVVMSIDKSAASQGEGSIPLFLASAFHNTYTIDTTDRTTCESEWKYS